MARDDTLSSLTRLESQGEFLPELQQHLEKGHAERAAKLYALAPPEVGGELLEQSSGAPPVYRESLARMFYEARDYYRAAVVYEGLKQLERAADLYEKAGELQLAAEAHYQLGQKKRAAELFARRGFYSRAGELFAELGEFGPAALAFERAKRPAQAAHYFFMLGDTHRAAGLLEQLGPKDFDFVRGVLLHVEILVEEGKLKTPMLRIERVLEEAGTDEKTAPLVLRLAQLCDQHGEPAKGARLRRELEDRGLLDHAAKTVEIVARMAQTRPQQRSSTAPPPAAPAPAPPRAPQPAAPAPDLLENVDALEFLKGTPLFRTLTLDEIRALYQVCEEKIFPPGAVLIEQGIPGEALYILRKGNLAVQRVTPQGAQTVTVLKPGAHVGEMSLVDPHADTSARIVARETVRAFEITRGRFLKLMSLDTQLKAKVYEIFAETLCARLRLTTAELARLRSEHGF